MSTFLYAMMTTKRDEAPEKKSTETSPGVKTYIDAMSALIPAEVLALHATLIQFGTKTSTDGDGQSVTTITDAGTLQWVFAGLVILSMFIYGAARWKKLDHLDVYRIWIPPAAFVGWTMLQNSTASMARMQL